MILDTSAIVAILQDEPEAEAFARAIEENRPVRLSAANWLEAAVVVDGNRSPVLSRRFDALLREAAVEIERERPIVPLDAAAGTLLTSTLGTALPMLWPWRETKHSCSRAMILPARTCVEREYDEKECNEYQSKLTATPNSPQSFPASMHRTLMEGSPSWTAEPQSSTWAAWPARCC
jgi:hypothetical protein